MRILQVISYFTPRKGGDVNVCCNISKQLAMRGHEVTVITTDLEFDNEYAESIRKLGVKVIPFSCVANISMFLMSPSIKNWLKANIYQYNVIHMHNFRSYQNNEVLHYAKKYNVPYVLQAHGSLPYFAKQNLKKLYDFVWGNKILHNASRVIALHKTEADQYKKMGVVEEKIDVISNGIDLSEYESLPERGQFRNKYHIKDCEKIILYLGRIHKSKGIDLLIAAYSELFKDLKDSKLVIVGPDDGHLSELKNQTTELGIEDKVLFTGPLFNRDKLTAFVDADVFVTPKFSGLPVTFIEACACGLPIITTTEGDDIDWINNNVGFVVEYSVSSISQSIVKLLQDDKLQSRFGNKGKDLVRNELNWGRISKCFEELYSSLCRVI
jgi:glycosyltransferase involved in cell wall biosynthesis